MDNTVQYLCEKAGYETRSYSGRGMYGRACLGVDIDNNKDITSLFADILALDELDDCYVREEFADAFHSAKSDSMGLGMIVYFPTIKYIAGPDDRADKPDFEPDENEI